MPNKYLQLRYILLFLSFLSLSLAASPTSFCKCTCFSNSTIIPLDATDESLKSNTFFTSNANTTTSDKSADNNDDDDGKKKAARTCNDCNKQFCLSYNLPICKDAEEEDVFTTCFQRDSTKDEVVVLLFIFATVGLLAWAAVKPWYEKWREGVQLRGTYAPVSSGGGGQ
ncbi:hypothetical protein PRZ48_012927 [Zasmidium cellare]|uniref:Uncharacterized protein n=1 Tax=Zasmidium cellare TaxID=395010 RepID=A0ABR0E2U5_ZASCE|nr:hypothetical protein PRZ48_012927 [Zasmidium cellare]